MNVRLSQWRHLADGWDGDGSRAPEAAHIDVAEHLLGVLLGADISARPMLNANGIVGIYWRTCTECADIEIESTTHCSLFVRWIETGAECLVENAPIDAGILALRQRVVAGLMQGS